MKPSAVAVVLPKVGVRAGDASVAGNSAVIDPELAKCVTDVAPVTVKKFAVTPVSVKPDAAVSVIVAV